MDGRLRWTAASDGRWLSVDGRELYEVQKAAGMLYKAASSDRDDLPATIARTAADMVLAHRDVVSLTCPDQPGACHGSRRYSTGWILQTEQAILDTVECGHHAGVAVASDEHVEAAVTGLGSDQAKAVRRLCGEGDWVAVMVGPAGSGKSASLAAARQAWESSRVPVRGVAPSAAAAGVLGEQAGIRSDTLAKFLADTASHRRRLAPGEVVVCDEASMVSTRDLAELVLPAEAVDVKVVLVGDHLQLGSVDAGGLFRLLAADTRTAELTAVRRFSDAWEADASRRLRAGDRTVILFAGGRSRHRSDDLALFRRDGGYSGACPRVTATHPEQPFSGLNRL